MKSADQKSDKTVDLCFISSLLAAGISYCGDGGGRGGTTSVREGKKEKRKKNQSDADGLTQELRV